MVVQPLAQSLRHASVVTKLRHGVRATLAQGVTAVEAQTYDHGGVPERTVEVGSAVRQ